MTHQGELPPPGPQRLLAVVEQGRLLRTEWMGVSVAGKLQLCALAALSEAAQMAESPWACLDDEVPQWLAHLMVDVSGRVHPETWEASVARLAGLALRWHVLDPVKWEAVQMEWLWWVLDRAERSLGSADKAGVRAFVQKTKAVVESGLHVNLYAARMARRTAQRLERAGEDASEAWEQASKLLARACTARLELSSLITEAERKAREAHEATWTAETHDERGDLHDAANAASLASAVLQSLDRPDKTPTILSEGFTPGLPRESQFWADAFGAALDCIERGVRSAEPAGTQDSEAGVTHRVREPSASGPAAFAAGRCYRVRFAVFQPVREAPNLGALPDLAVRAYTELHSGDAVVLGCTHPAGRWRSKAASHCVADLFAGAVVGIPPDGGLWVWDGHLAEVPGWHEAAPVPGWHGQWRRPTSDEAAEVLGGSVSWALACKTPPSQWETSAPPRGASC